MQIQSKNLIFTVLIFSLALICVEAKKDINQIRKMADRGSTNSQRWYAMELLSKNNSEEAYRYLIKAIHEGNSSEASKDLARYLRKGYWSESFLRNQKESSLVKTEAQELSKALSEYYYKKAQSLGATEIDLELLADDPSPKELFETYKNLETSTADCVLGQLYALGEGVNKDSNLAIEHLNHCATLSRGAFSNLSLASLYIHRQNQSSLDRKMASYWMTQNYDRATSSRRLFQVVKKAALRGNSQAQFLYAFSLSIGVESVNDVYSKYKKAKPIKAFEWMVKAAKSGNVIAQSFMGSFFLNGTGTRKDINQAIAWHSKAAESGFPSSLYIMGKWYLFAQYGLQKDEAKAYKYLSKAANAGEVNAIYYMGRIYKAGLGVKKDLKEAARWYTKGANLNHWFSQYELAHFYFNGQGVKPDYQLAFRLFSVGVKKKDKDAYSMLARMYAEGLGTPQDHKKAEEYFSQLETDYGDYRLYCLHVDPSNPNKNPSKGIKGLKHLATKGHTWSAVKLGDIYRDGQVINKNKAEAIQWYERAVKLGSKDSKLEIERLKKGPQGNAIQKKSLTAKKPIEPPLRLKWTDTITEVLDRLISKSGIDQIKIRLDSKIIGEIKTQTINSQNSKQILSNLLSHGLQSTDYCFGLSQDKKVYAYPVSKKLCQGNGASFNMAGQLAKTSDQELIIEASLVKLNAIPFRVLIKFSLNSAFSMSSQNSNLQSLNDNLPSEVHKNLEKLINGQESYSNGGLVLPTKLKSVELISDSDNLSLQGLKVIGLSLSKKYLPSPSDSQMLEIKDSLDRSLTIEFTRKKAQISYEQVFDTKKLQKDYMEFLDSQNTIEDSLGEL